MHVISGHVTRQSNYNTWRWAVVCRNLFQHRQYHSHAVFWITYLHWLSKDNMNRSKMKWNGRMLSDRDANLTYLIIEYLTRFWSHLSAIPVVHSFWYKQLYRGDKKCIINRSSTCPYLASRHGGHLKMISIYRIHTWLCKWEKKQNLAS